MEEIMLIICSIVVFVLLDLLNAPSPALEYYLEAKKNGEY